jgi:hypothetical protein
LPSSADTKGRVCAVCSLRPLPCRLGSVMVTSLGAAGASAAAGAAAAGASAGVAGAEGLAAVAAAGADAGAGTGMLTLRGEREVRGGEGKRQARRAGSADDEDESGAGGHLAARRGSIYFASGVEQGLLI